MIIDSGAKRARGVANTAIFHGRYVVEWFTAGFAGNAGVTAGCRAIVHDPCMVETGTDETTCGMANTTILVCWHMVSGLAFSEHAVMTGSAVIHDTCMVKGRRHKARGLVAVAAVIVGWHMVRRRHFSSGGYTIVARRTVVSDSLMIEPGVGKGRRNMAYRAILGSRNVGGVGPGIFAGCGNTVVAGDTVADNSRMIKHSV